MKRVRLVAKTEPTIDSIPGSEELISYCCRVSNKKNQENWETAPGLIEWCIKNKHWSILEMVNVTFEIITTRAISAQLLRHRSFSAQELSTRYTQVAVEYPELRLKGSSNRQGSLDELADPEAKAKVIAAIDHVYELYTELIDPKGYNVALESARMILPMCSSTTLYFNGTLRSWLHYCDVRTDEHTQKEHREIAKEVQDIIFNLYPSVASGWEQYKSL